MATLNLPLILPLSGFSKNSDVKINLDFILAQFEALNGGTSTWTSVSIGTAGSTTGPLILYNSSNTNSTTIQAGAAAANLVFTLPTTDGNNLDVLTTDGTGVLSWTAASGANTALSNLTTTNINQALVANSDFTYNIGSSSVSWNTVYAHTISNKSTGADLLLTATGTNRSVILSPNGNGTVQSTKSINIASTFGLTFAGASRNLNLLATEPATSSRTITFPDPGADGAVVYTVSSQTIGGAKTLSSALTITPTTNQLVLGTTNTTTINATAPAASRTLTIPDPGGAASFVMTAGTQTISGTKTFDGQLIGKGTATNDSAAAGYIGETAVSQVSTLTNFPTSGQFGDFTSISLTAGDWDVTIVGEVNVKNATAMTDLILGVSTTSGNSGTGLTIGTSRIYKSSLTTSASDYNSYVLPNVRISLSATTTVYFKYTLTYSTDTPQIRGEIRARRAR